MSREPEPVLDPDPDPDPGPEREPEPEPVREAEPEPVREAEPPDPAAGSLAAGSRHRVRAVAAGVTTALACLLVLTALLIPDRLDHLTPGGFLRIPVEGLLGAALLLVLPPRARRVTAVLLGVALGLLTIWKVVDMGFFSVLSRPFNPVFDLSLLTSGVDFLRSSVGQTGANVAVVVAAVLAAAVLVLVPLSLLRLTRILVRHRPAATRAVMVLGVAWVGLAVLGVQVVPGVPVAAHSTDRVILLGESLQDRQEFAEQAAVDAFRDTPGEQLLTGLRGKDVVVAFVESYGRSAVEDPRLGPQIGAELDAGSRRLREAGFASRSAFLTSPTAGGGSWVAHATLLSGLWVDNQQRYDTLVTSDRLTLNGAFERAGWRTVAVMPGAIEEWGPEKEFYGYDQIYDSGSLGYQGPRTNWGRMPDQYTLSVFERSERSRPAGSGRPPVMAEVALVTSHAPWTPTPPLVDWDAVGDGSVFDTVPVTGAPPEDVLRDPAVARTEYRLSIEYSLRTLVSYLETYGDDDLVLVLLGDHQPASLVTGADASRDVPVTLVARDPAVLDRISGWGWQEGLRPDPQAPVWRMDAFRDRFLTAFGSPATPAPSTGSSS